MNISNEDPREEVVVRKQKSRDLDIYEFFKILQLEALVGELRSKIYPKIKDKNYWKKYYENKKKIVLDIAERNKVGNTPLPSIFTDEGILESLKQEVYGDGGFPKFIYKDKEQEYVQGFYDCVNYYAKGSRVACRYLDEIKIGVVKYYQAHSKTVSVTLDGNENVEFEIKNVTRIL